MKRKLSGRHPISTWLTGVTLALIFLVMGMPGPGDAQGPEASKAGEAKPSQSSAISGEFYQLQLNSFKVESNAKRFFDRLVKKGYKPFMVFVDEGEPWFKVRMGPYPSRQTANQVATELKKKHSLPSLILFAGKNDPVSSGSASLKEKGSAKITKTALPSPKISAKSTGSEQDGPPQVTSENTGSSIDVVLSQFLVWLQAWQGKQLDSYFSFYSRSFESGGKPFTDWQQAQKKSLNLIRQIKIEVDDLEMAEKRGYCRNVIYRALSIRYYFGHPAQNPRLEKRKRKVEDHRRIFRACLMVLRFNNSFSDNLL